MMFTIIADGELIYHPQVEELQMLDAVLSKENNMADNFTFSPHPENHFEFEKLKTIVEVFRNGNRVFRGRILNEEIGMNGIRSYTCEGELAYLNDSIVRPYDWTSGGVDAYFRFLIQQHNDQVEPERRFVARTVTVVENASTGNIIRSSTIYPSTLTELGDKLTHELGGHLYVEHLDGVTYIDYLADSLNASSQKIKLGENIINLDSEVSAEDIATGIIPLGAELENVDTNTLNKRLTIETVNNGKDFIVDSIAVAKHGIILKPIIFDDIT